MAPPANFSSYNSATQDSDSTMGCCLSRRMRRSPEESLMSSILTDPQHTPEHPAVSHPSLQAVGHGQNGEDTLTPGDELQHMPSHTVENEEIVVATIRATDVVLGLRRIPAGFYAVVHHGGHEWKTESKHSLVNNDVIEWSDPIPIPSDLSTIIRIEVYASFEFQPTLGAGEQLRELTTTVEQLLDRSANSIPFNFLPKDGDVVSPCSSISVTVQRRKHANTHASALKMLVPLCSNTESRNEVEETTDHGHSALSRYRKRGEKQDLEYSIQQFERALEICPLDHPCRAAAQSNLAMAKLVLSQVEDTDTSLEEAIRLYRDALTARPVGHLDRPLTLIYLAAACFAQSQKRRDHREDSEVESLLHEVINLGTIESHENRAATFTLQVHAERSVGLAQVDSPPAEEDSGSSLIQDGLQKLGCQLMQRFEQSSDLASLKLAITVFGELVRSTSIRNEQHQAGLANLAVALMCRFNHLGELSDLERAILLLKEAVEQTPRDHPDKPIRLGNLGNAIRIRFEHLGELSDLENAISTLVVAVELTPQGHSGNFGCLHNLGNSFTTRFERLGRLSDIEAAISTLRKAAELTPRGHPKRPACLNDLGISFKTRFERLGELSDLKDAILVLREAINLLPHNHTYKPACLTNLGNSLSSHFMHSGQLSDLEDAISTHREAVDLTPHGHPDKPVYLNNLSNSLITRFERLGHLNDLEDAITTLKDAVDFTSHSHPDKLRYLQNLGNSLRTHFEHVGHLPDLEDAISILRNVVELTPYGYPEMPDRLSIFGDSLRIRFWRLGQLSDLEDAIAMLRDAVKLTPHDNPHKLGYLNNLGQSLVTRSDRFGQLSDLEEGILMLTDVVMLTPCDHPHRPIRLNNLGYSLLLRFERLENPDDLEDATSALMEAVELTPHDNPDKPVRLGNLGTCFSARFKQLEELSDLERSISVLRKAVELTPHSHPYKFTFLNNLGNCLISRFERLRDLNDVEEAILRQTEAIDLTPHGHLHKSTCFYNLGRSIKIRFDYLGERRDVEQAISLFSHTASSPIGSIRVRLRASRMWIACAQHIRHHTLLKAYSIALSLLPQLAWIGLPLSDRYSELLVGANVVRGAAAAALDEGLPETAVEWLEQGRSIVWGELFQLRSSFDELSSVHPNLAHKLRELSAELDQASAIHEKSLSAHSEQIQDFVHHSTETSHQVADTHRRLAIERDKLLGEVRRLPGFEQFLLHKEFSQLRTSAHSGPVVILNTANTRCDALIVLADLDHAIHVPLPNFPLQRAADLHNMMKGFVRDAREGKKETQDGLGWESLLSPLWKCVVKPVLDALAISAPGDLSRIFWCPTGPFAFLPLHAAGFYDDRYSELGHKVFNFVVSSYTPTLSVLSPSSNPVVEHTDNLHLLLVPQPSSDGQTRLPGVVIELEHIKDVVKTSPGTTILESSTGTVEEVLDLLKRADWCHFACHGIQDGVDSGLCLADERRLRLRDIIGVSRPRGGLAFLSACQTAMGEMYLSDEAIHIAAGMLFAGYGGVVGTMWSISDRLAPIVARDVYEHLFRNGARPDYRDAARALHEAIEWVRDTGRVSLAEWVPFIHVGL